MSNYWQLLPKSNDVLLISFSHVNLAPGTFAHPNALKDFPYSILHINCPNNSYYIREIPGVGSDVAGIAEFIKARIAEVAPGKVVCYGSSMGAFGALLYGFLVASDLIVSLAPEVPLGLHGALSRSLTKDRSIFDQSIATDVIDLVRPGKTTLFALCGEKAPADLVAGVTLREKIAGCCHSLKNAFHDLAPFIQAVWGLNRFLLETIETGMPREFMSTYEGDALLYPDFVQRLYQLTVEGGEESAFRELIDRVPREASAACHAYASMTYAQYLGKLGRVAEAVALLRHAFDCNPGDPVGAALFFQYSPDEFLSIGLGDDYFRDMLQAYRLNRPPVFYRLSALLSRYCPDVLSRIEAEMGALMRYPSHQAEFAFHLGNLLLAEGDISGAERHLGHAVDLDPSNPALQRALKSVHAQQGTYPAAARAPAGYAPANVGLTA